MPDEPKVDATPIRERELRTLAKCRVCGEPIGKKKIPVLWKARLERHWVDTSAIARQTGFTAVCGGNAALAQALGPDEPMTKPLDAMTVMICDECVIERIPELLL